MIDYQSITKESILKSVSQEEIFERYFSSDFIIGRSIKSPFRKDLTPSFSLFYSDNNILLYKDHAYNEVGNCFKFVMRLFNLNFQDTLKKISYDFKLSNTNSPVIGSGNIIYNPNKSIYNLYKLRNKNPSQITYTKKEWSQSEYKWWESYGVSKEGITEYNINLADKIFYQNKLWLIGSRALPIYVYQKGSEFKFYRPLSPKGYRWNGNMRSNTLLGIEYIPDGYNELIILTKSYKDCVSIWENSGIRCICKAGENCYWTKEDIDLIKTKSDNFIYLGDFDRTGIHIAWKLKKDFGIKPVFMSTNRFERRYDYSDYYLTFGKEQTIQKLNSLLKKHNL